MVRFFPLQRALWQSLATTIPGSEARKRMEHETHAESQSRLCIHTNFVLGCFARLTITRAIIKNAASRSVPPFVVFFVSRQRRQHSKARPKCTTCCQTSPVPSPRQRHHPYRVNRRRSIRRPSLAKSKNRNLHKVCLPVT